MILFGMNRFTVLEKLVRTRVTRLIFLINKIVKLLFVVVFHVKVKLKALLLLRENRFL